MDALLLPDERCERGRPSRMVLIPRRWDQALAGRSRGRWWLTSPVHQGEYEAAVNTIAQGMSDRFGVPVVTTRVLSTFAHEAAGAPDTRHSLRPLVFEGDLLQDSLQDSGASCRGNAKVCSYFRHCEERKRRSNPEWFRGDSLDCFASLAMTGML